MVNQTNDKLKLFVGKNVGNKPSNQAVEKFSGHGEFMLGIFRGKRNKYTGRSFGEKLEQSLGLKRHYCIIMSEKIIFWMRGLFTKDFAAFEYSRLVTVEGKKGLRAGDLILHFFGHQERFRDMNKNEGEIASNIVKGQLEILRKRQAANQYPNNEIREIVEDPLSIAGSRYAKGEITKKEYDQIVSDLQKLHPKQSSFCRSCGVENGPEAAYCIECGTLVN